MTQEAIAQHFGVSLRTIERWASQDGWGARKKAQKVVSIGDAKSKTQPPKPHPVNNSSPTLTREPVRVRRRDSEIDELEIVDGAIASLAAALTTGTMQRDDGGEVHYSVSGRDLGTCASALIKVLAYRRQIKPPTAAELAEQAIALGMSPAEFARELRQAWEKRA